MPSSARQPPAAPAYGCSPVRSPQRVSWAEVVSARVAAVSYIAGIDAATATIGQKTKGKAKDGMEEAHKKAEAAKTNTSKGRAKENVRAAKAKEAKEKEKAAKAKKVKEKVRVATETSTIGKKSDYDLARGASGAVDGSTADLAAPTARIQDLIAEIAEDIIQQRIAPGQNESSPSHTSASIRLSC